MKKTIISCMPLVPTLFHWILPAGIENKMYIIFWGIIPFFIFNLCYLVYLSNYHMFEKKNIERIPQRVKTLTVIFSILFLSYSLIQGICVGVDNLILQIMNNQALVYSLLLFILFPMSYDMIERTKFIVIPAAIVLGIEVILYSLGILQYSVDLGSNELGGVLRISTTVGAATGTAVSLVMLGVIILYYKSINIKFKFALIILLTVAIFFLQSRGSIALWSVYLVYFVYKQYLQHSHFKTKFRVFLICIVSVFILMKIGVFAPVLERQRLLVEDNNMFSGRDELKQKAMQAFIYSEGMGVGLGQTNYDKSLGLVKINKSFSIGVHNHYYCVLAELGFYGLILLVGYFLTFLTSLDVKSPIFIYVILLLSLTFSTEPIFVYAEFTYPAAFILMLSLKRSNKQFI